MKAVTALLRQQMHVRMYVNYALACVEDETIMVIIFFFLLLRWLGK